VIRWISRYLSDVDNLIAIYSVIVLVIAAIALISLIALPIGYEDTQVYPKNINTSSSLNPYDRGGEPFGITDVMAQYPQNSPYLGYVTAYLTPLSALMAASDLYLGTTIVSHPGGIIDEILYNTRGMDTIVETSILFIAFAIASFLFRREE
jgi:energy-converting hydrogenase A subunit F